MKGINIVIVLLLLTVALNAQLIDITSYIHQSAVTPTNQILLRLASVEQLAAFNIEALTLQDGTQYTATFQPANISEQTLVIQAPAANLPQIAFRVQESMVTLLIPWQISAAQASQPLYYIQAGESPEGVTTGTSDNYTDLRSQYFSITENSFNVMLENAAGTYPSSLNQMYIYGSMILNADRLLELDIDFENFDLENIDPAILAQLHAFAAMYCNISFLTLIQITPGIYKLPLSLLLDPESIDLATLIGSLAPIASITSSISSGALLIRANYSNLANDPDFGEWPNLSNCLITIPFILHLTNILNPVIDLDIGTPTVVYCTPYELFPQTNTTVTINTGTMTPYLYEVIYESPGGFYPFTAKFTNINQEVFLPVTASMDFLQGAAFYFSSTSLLYSGTFEFSADGRNTTTLDYEDPYSIDDNVIDLPPFVLENYPNPFNPQTSIRYSVARDEFVNISVYNIKGQRVKTLLTERKPAGTHEVIWNGTDELGRVVSSGIYCYQLTTPEGSYRKKMLMMK